MRISRALWLAAVLGSAVGSASSAYAGSTREIVAIFSRNAIQEGQAVGVGVAVIYGPAAPRLYTFGKSFAGSGATPARPFAPDDLFEIGSVTKVFTTNLLGQAVHRGQRSLSDPLSAFSAALGTLKPLTSQVTLQQLADFTGGIADYAPSCSEDDKPGCLPSGRPTITEYSARHFAAFFRRTRPMDFTTPTPTRAKALPAPYYYSDFSVGLLGLLLANQGGALSNRDLNRWYRMVTREILRPLGMQSTFLDVPADQTSRLVGGYQQALARAEVSGGQVTAISLTSHGARYTQAPRVRLVGGGGTGARAKATFDEGRVSEITVTQGGTGYLAPATVNFNDGGSTTEAEANIIVQDGKVVAIAMRAGGAGYKQVPNVSIVGGRAPSGSNAQATAHLVNGQVAYVTIDDPGEGYVTPLSVIVEPGEATQNAIPIWAPAGALTTSLTDLSQFARAALLSKRLRDPVPRRVAAGFRIAQAPYACTGDDPSLDNCPAGQMQSGLSWAVQPADKVNRVPSIVIKDGGLPGFSTYVALMPDAGIAVVTMVNSRSPVVPPLKEPAAAAHLANNILYAVHAACQSPGGCPP